LGVSIQSRVGENSSQTALAPHSIRFVGRHIPAKSNVMDLPETVQLDCRFISGLLFAARAMLYVIIGGMDAGCLTMRKEGPVNWTEVRPTIASPEGSTGMR
jgi:hypothetical protein